MVKTHDSYKNAKLKASNIKSKEKKVYWYNFMTDIDLNED